MFFFELSIQRKQNCIIVGCLTESARCNCPVIRQKKVWQFQNGEEKSTSTSTVFLKKLW